MQYELSPNDRFFLNQLIPKWESGKPFDLYGDTKYVFHREMGVKYNTALFEQTVENIRSFLSDHGFAKENPAKQYSFNLLPKGNMLMVKGTIEQFEYYQEMERTSGKSIVIPAKAPVERTKARQEVFLTDNYTADSNRSSPFLRILLILAAIFVVVIIAKYLTHA